MAPERWPADWPRYRQPCFGSNDSRCDMLIGPCSCGAWHARGEFVFKDGVLFRDGKQVMVQVMSREGEAGK